MIELHPWAHMPSLHRSRPIRLFGLELSRQYLGSLAENYTEGGPGNRHCVRRWLHALYGPFLVASDALALNDRPRAIAVLLEVLRLEDALRVTEPIERLPDRRFRAGGNRH